MITIALNIKCGRLCLCANANANINLPKHQKAAGDGEIVADNIYNLRFVVWRYGAPPCGCCLYTGE